MKIDASSLAITFRSVTPHGLHWDYDLAPTVTLGLCMEAVAAVLSVAESFVIGACTAFLTVHWIRCRMLMPFHK
jgi:hypothetical protein